MSLTFLKQEEIKDLNILAAIDTCEGKCIIYGEKNNDVLQGLVLVEITKQVEIKAMALYEESALPALIQGVKNKYKNKDLMTKITEYNLSPFGFVEGKYIRADHLEDAFLNIDELVERYPVKLSEKQIVLSYISLAIEIGKIYTEKEINALIKSRISFDDYVTIRRDLYDFGYLDRLENGMAYKRVK